jgi:hypothetical protein
MAVRTVVDPDGRTWRVKRKWLSRSVSWRGPADVNASLAPDLTDFVPLDDDIGCLPALGVAITGIAVVLLAIFFVLPALVFAVELLAVLVLLLLGAMARVLFRRPWTVEARVKGTNQGREWKVVGWRASGELVAQVAERVRSTGKAGGEITWS